MTARDAFKAKLMQEAITVRKQRKSDDIIDFIIDNWKWFVRRKGDMIEIKNNISISSSYSVDALCDALNIPDNVFFKRSPVVDIGGALLNFPASKFMELFISCCEKSSNSEATLFIVAGKKSICITNMQTTFDDDIDMILYFRTKGDLPDIHIFKTGDLLKRLPDLFEKQEI